MAAHVAGCEACADELAAIREVREAIRQLPPVVPPPGFVLRPSQPKVAREDLGRRSAMAQAVLASVAAAVVALLAIRTPVIDPPVTDATGAHRESSQAFAPPAEEQGERHLGRRAGRRGIGR